MIPVPREVAFDYSKKFMAELNMTEQQAKVSVLALYGLSAANMAEIMCCSVANVKDHLTKAYRTVGVKSVLQLAVTLMRKGYFAPDNSDKILIIKTNQNLEQSVLPIGVSHV